MPLSDAPIRPEDLLAHAGWLRSLARSLVRDAAVAQDLAQDTLVAALRHPPADDRPLRPWLARVLRNYATMAFRRQEASDRRLASVAPDAVAPSPDVLVERVQSARLLATLVLGLREP